MRTVEAHLLEDKMEEAVTHYINSHHPNEPVHIDTNGIPMTVQDDGAGRVTIMHQQTYTTQMCRQVSVTEQVGDGPWGEELLEGPIAAIVAHLQNSRHHPPPHHKIAQVRSDVDTSVILDGTMRFNAQSLEQHTEPIVVQLPPMQTLPPLHTDMKRCTDTDWFSDKNKKVEQSMLQDSDSQVLEMASSSPAQHKQQNRKSLPHKKRISRKLKRNNGNSTPQQDQLVVINCSEAEPAPPDQEQILPDNYVSVPHAAHITHEVRPVLICQICGEYYGEEQLKFYHHLKQHYEPHHTIIIENPVPDLPCDKMSTNCIVDNVATLPDSIVELSLENTVPKTIYQPIDKHILYTSSDKTLTYNTNKLQYSMASMEKEPDKPDLYETLDKLDLYSCGKCTKTFRKQKQCEAHMRDAHPNNTKCEDMGEFSEPEDLMAGIQVCVGAEYEPPAPAPPPPPPPPPPHHLLPHLTVDNGHVHQDHAAPWYGRGPPGGAGGACGAYCAVCAREPDTPYKLLKEEVLQRIFDSEVSDNANFADNMISDHDVGDQDHNHDQEHENNDHSHEHNDHDLRHNDHGHEHNERSHVHNNPHIHNEHSQIHNEHLRHNEHSQHSQEHNEHDQDHHELSHGHNDFIHGHNEVSHGHNEQSQGHDNGHVHNDHGHEHIDHSHEHNDHSQEHNDHIQEHNDHSQEHNGNSQEHNETSQEHYEVFKHEIKVKVFNCTKCDRVFSHRNSLLYHLLSHEGKQHTCRECGKEFYTLGALKIHRRVHNNVRPYKCETCGREFRQWSDLKYHSISIHSDKKHFKCEYCGKEFARKYSLNLHVKIHTGEKNYKCNYCSKTFRCSSYRLTHMRTHTGDRPYKCDECDKSFRAAFDLRRHSLIHDKIRNRFDEHKPKPKDNQKKTKMTDTKEVKEERLEQLEPPPKKMKQIAVASTTRQAALMKKLQKPKKAKKGAPNVTIQNRDGQFKINNEFTNNIEVYDGRIEYAKLKNIYTQNDRNQIIKDAQTQQRDLAILRPIGHRTESLEEKTPYRAENTDGKMQVYTHVEKGKEYNGSIVSNNQVLGDIRHLEREVRSEIAGEGIETAFLERLTAMYNIPAV